MVVVASTDLGPYKRIYEVEILKNAYFFCQL